MEPWYYSTDHHKRLGPVSEADLVRALSVQPRPFEALVWHPGLPGWQRAAEVERIAGALEQALAPPPLPGTSELPAAPAGEHDTVAMGRGTADESRPGEDETAVWSSTVSPDEGAPRRGGEAPAATPSDRWAGLSSAPVPWRRFMARYTDVILFALVLGVASFEVGWLDTLFRTLETRAPSPELVNLLFGMFVLIAWIPFEAGMLSMMGTTPGKALFGLRVARITAAGRRAPTYDEAFVRGLRVCLQGMAAGLPLISLIAMGVQYQSLKRDGRTTYDPSGTSAVLHAPWGRAARVMATALFVFGLFIPVLVLDELASRGALPGGTPIASPETAAERIEIANRCERTLDIALSYRTEPAGEWITHGWYSYAPEESAPVTLEAPRTPPLFHIAAGPRSWPGQSERHERMAFVVDEAFTARDGSLDEPGRYVVPFAELEPRRVEGAGPPRYALPCP